MRTVIVGAGPAGAALAFLLARRGLEVTLVERESSSERVFRGEALMPTGLAALAQMGLGERVARLPGDPIECWQVFLDKLPTMYVPEPLEELGDRAFRIVSQPALLDLLIEQASAQVSFSFLPGTSVRGLLREEGRVSGVRISAPDGERALEADLVIGADGRASTVRKRAGLELRLLPESYDVVWLKLPAPKELETRRPLQIYASGPDAALGYVSWDGRWQVAWMLPKGGWRELKGERGSRDWLADCAALMPDSLGAHLLAERAAIEGPTLLDVIVGRCDTWHAPGLLLLGDAAHPMSPVRAQGINMALRDAIVAANHLVPALAEAASPDGLSAALAAIQAEREREIVPIQKLQIREVRGQRWARERPWLMRPMLKLAPLIANRAFVARAFLRQQRPLRFGVSEVELRV